MKKKIIISGGLQDMVTYCTAVYKLGEDFNSEMLIDIIKQSPIFENKNFCTNVQGTVQRTTVARKSSVFINEGQITLQIRYEMLKVVEIELTEKDETWIKNDIEKLLEHFEVLLLPFEN